MWMAANDKQQEAPVAEAEPLDLLPPFKDRPEGLEETIATGDDAASGKSMTRVIDSIVLVSTWQRAELKDAVRCPADTAHQSGQDVTKISESQWSMDGDRSAGFTASLLNSGSTAALSPHRTRIRDVPVRVLLQFCDLFVSQRHAPKEDKEDDGVQGFASQTPSRRLLQQSRATPILRGRHLVPAPHHRCFRWQSRGVSCGPGGSPPSGASPPRCPHPALGLLPEAPP